MYTLKELPKHSFLRVLIYCSHHLILKPPPERNNTAPSSSAAPSFAVWIIVGTINKIMRYLQKSSAHSGLIPSIDSYISSEQPEYFIMISWEVVDINSYTSALSSVLILSSKWHLSKSAVSWICLNAKDNQTLSTIRENAKNWKDFLCGLTTNSSMNCLRSLKPLFSASVFG